MSQRRRRSYTAKRPASRVSIITTVVGAVGLFIYLVFFLSAQAGFSIASKALAGIGVIIAVVCLVAGVKGIDPFRDTAYDTLSRWAGIILPFAGFVAWIITYFIGIIFG